CYNVIYVAQKGLYISLNAALGFRFATPQANIFRPCGTLSTACVTTGLIMVFAIGCYLKWRPDGTIGRIGRWCYRVRH
ncbi:MAG: hypothetical protein PHY48_11200, partial [Candidatus Cloacimonetes bacterium]|nr:hypothetical protein [Candidatus Cloacimonadota bacterium]